MAIKNRVSTKGKYTILYDSACIGRGFEIKNEAYLFVPYNEEYYQGLAMYIEEAWQEFNM